MMAIVVEGTRMHSEQPDNYIDNWPVALVDFAKDIVGSEWELGHTDCASVAFFCLDLIVDGGLPFNIEWGSLREAKEQMTSDAMESRGFVEVNPRFSQAGDVCLWNDQDNDGLWGLGIMLPARMVLTSHRDRGVHTAKVLDYEGVTFWRYRGI